METNPPQSTTSFPDEVSATHTYTLRYLKLIVLEGNCRIPDVYLREYANPEATRAKFVSSNERCNRIFEAARQTFRQNAVDIFMDCPSRERAGWLCDSFFTARVAADLCGNTTVEKNFLENFQRPEKFEYLPEGMLPMCYPSDHNNGEFIPNWAMWFVLELVEYAQRSGDRQLVEALRPRVLKLLDFLKRYENEDGLLEKLPSWVFIEWSKANSFVQDVNYPSSMLYAGALDAAGRVYYLPALDAKAARVREVIRRQSFDGEFFVDNAVRKDGKLEVTTNHTEVCQYFAFFYDVATPSSHPKLWRTLTTDFGPQRKQTKAFPCIRRTPSLATSSVLSCSPGRDATSRFWTRRSATGLTWPTAPAHSGSMMPRRLVAITGLLPMLPTSSSGTCSGSTAWTRWASRSSCASPK